MIHDIQLGIAKNPGVVFMNLRNLKDFVFCFSLDLLPSIFCFVSQVACEASDKKPRRKGKWKQAKVGPGVETSKNY